MVSDTRFDCWSEVSENYADTLCVLNDSWRVVVCRDLLHWSLQQRRRSTAPAPDSRRSPERPATSRQPKSYTVPGVDWQGRGFFSVAADLRRAALAHSGEIDPVAVAVLAGLPDRIGGRPRKAAPSPSVEETRDARNEEACPFDRLYAQLQRTAGNVAPNAGARPVAAAAPDPAIQTRPTGADEWAPPPASAEGHRHAQEGGAKQMGEAYVG
jgi:hypothetical protein